MKGIILDKDQAHAAMMREKTKFTTPIEVPLWADPEFTPKDLTIVPELPHPVENTGTAPFAMAQKAGDEARLMPIEPPYLLNELLFLQEPWFFQPCTGKCYYETTSDRLPSPHSRYQPAEEMPNKRARYFIQVQDVVACRLQGITELESEKEGLANRVIFEENTIYHDYFIEEYCDSNYFNLNTARESFITWWDSRHEYPFTWDDDPAVWRYTFRLLTRQQANYEHLL